MLCAHSTIFSNIGKFKVYVIIPILTTIYKDSLLDSLDRDVGMEEGGGEEKEGERMELEEEDRVERK